jgi:cytochrome c oxidase subunit 2
MGVDEAQQEHAVSERTTVVTSSLEGSPERPGVTAGMMDPARARGECRMRQSWTRKGRAAAAMLCALMCGARAWGENRPSAVPNMFRPTSTPAHEEFILSLFVIAITSGILIVVGGLWAYITWRFRQKSVHDDVEPPQVYGSTQIELAWTVVPFIIVVVLFLTTARMIFAIQDKPHSKAALDVTVVGHQFWWEFRYPKYGFVTANELHIPLSTKAHPLPTFLKLQSADVWHSFWVPQLAGKQDNIPDHTNYMWMDPTVPGMYVGQCGQFCGIEHAKMLIRVYVDTPDQFQRWIANQEQPSVQPASTEAEALAGKQVFLSNACMNCHQIEGTTAHGKFGPDLTHFASRETLGSGAAPNDMADLQAWIHDPSSLKEGALMPPMQLNDTQLEQVSVYLSTLK